MIEFIISFSSTHKLPAVSSQTFKKIANPSLGNPALNFFFIFIKTLFRMRIMWFSSTR